MLSNVALEILTRLKYTDRGKKLIEKKKNPKLRKLDT